MSKRVHKHSQKEGNELENSLEKLPRAIKKKIQKYEHKINIKRINWENLTYFQWGSERLRENGGNTEI